jgi:hypothetical protein
MPNKLFIENNVTLMTCPSVDNMEGIHEITLGDLHSNAIKLLYVLVRHGIVDLDEKCYQRLTYIYTTSLKLYDVAHLDVLMQLITEFEALVHQLRVINRHCLIRFIGDVLADRGNNDWFVLLLLNQLALEKVPYVIVMGNHDVAFMDAYEGYEKRGHTLESACIKGKGFTLSLHHLNFLVKHKLFSLEKLTALVERAYKPYLTLLSYSLHQKNQQITLFSHAAIGLNEPPCLARLMGVAYEDSTPADLAKTMDNIQEQFFKRYVTTKSMHLLFPTRAGELTSPIEAPLGLSIPVVNVLLSFTNNRDYSTLTRPHRHPKGYFLSFVHGHDLADPDTSKHIINLDNHLGKSSGFKPSSYQVLLFRKEPKPLPVIEKSWLDSIQFNHIVLAALGLSALYLMTKTSHQQQHRASAFR